MKVYHKEKKQYLKNVVISKDFLGDTIVGDWIDKDGSVKRMKVYKLEEVEVEE